MSATLAVLALMLAGPQSPSDARVADPGPPRRFYVHLAAESLQVTVARDGRARRPRAGPLRLGVCVPPPRASAPHRRLPGHRDRAPGHHHLRQAGGRRLILLTRHAVAEVPMPGSASRAVLVPHSAGASIALRLAYSEPRARASAVVLDSMAGPRSAPPAAAFAGPCSTSRGSNGSAEPSRARQDPGESVKSSGDTTWVSEEVVDGYTAGARADLDGTLKAYLRMAEAKEPQPVSVPHLADIRVPVRLIVGTAPHEGGIPEGQTGGTAARSWPASPWTASRVSASMCTRSAPRRAVIETIRTARRRFALER